MVYDKYAGFELMIWLAIICLICGMMFIIITTGNYFFRIFRDLWREWRSKHGKS